MWPDQGKIRLSTRTDQCCKTSRGKAKHAYPLDIDTVMIRPFGKHVVDSACNMFRPIQNRNRFAMVCMIISRVLLKSLKSAPIRGHTQLLCDETKKSWSEMQVTVR